LIHNRRVDPTSVVLATAHLDSESPPYVSRIRVGHRELVADEPHTNGGSDAGAAPYELLLASLAACTAITLRMYAARKGWDIGDVRVELTMVHEDHVERIERIVTVSAALTAEQRARLAEIAEKTPVTRTLKRGTSIATTFA
jgi:putative redox protein